MSEVTRAVDNVAGICEKMADDVHRCQVSGLKPVGPMKRVSNSMDHDRKGAVVEASAIGSEADVRAIRLFR